MRKTEALLLDAGDADRDIGSLPNATSVSETNNSEEKPAKLRKPRKPRTKKKSAQGLEANIECSSSLASSELAVALPEGLVKKSRKKHASDVWVGQFRGSNGQWLPKANPQTDVNLQVGAVPEVLSVPEEGLQGQGISERQQDSSAEQPSAPLAKPKPKRRKKGNKKHVIQTNEIMRVWGWRYSKFGPLADLVADHFPLQSKRILLALSCVYLYDELGIDVVRLHAGYPKCGDDQLAICTSRGDVLEIRHCSEPPTSILRAILGYLRKSFVEQVA